MDLRNRVENVDGSTRENVGTTLSPIMTVLLRCMGGGQEDARLEIYLGIMNFFLNNEFIDYFSDTSIKYLIAKIELIWAKVKNEKKK